MKNTLILEIINMCSFYLSDVIFSIKKS